MEGLCCCMRWLTHIFNAIMNLEVEEIPTIFKQGIIVPPYKGAGKDPQNCGSYRGVTLTSAMVLVIDSFLSVFCF